MHHPLAAVVRLLAALALLGGLGWGAGVAWQLRHARRAAAAVAALLTADSPPAAADVDPLALLQAAAPSLRDGDFQAVCDLLSPRPLTAAEQEAARRFLASHGELRERFVAAAEAGRRPGAEQAAAVRKRLASAACAAADGNAACVEACLALAQRAGETPLPGSCDPRLGAGPQAVAARLAAIAPALDLARDLMTEAYGPAQRLVGRANRLWRQQQYGQAAVSLDLAGELLGAPSPTFAQAAEVPAWFSAMSQPPPDDATPAQARAMVSFCEAVARSQGISPAVKWMIAEARRQRDAGRPAESRWWATVALEALGISGEAAAAGSAAAEPPP
jgi:hypothetical protein